MSKLEKTFFGLIPGLKEPGKLNFLLEVLT